MGIEDVTPEETDTLTDEEIKGAMKESFPEILKETSEYYHALSPQVKRLLGEIVQRIPELPSHLPAEKEEVLYALLLLYAVGSNVICGALTGHTNDDEDNNEFSSNDFQVMFLAAVLHYLPRDGFPDLYAFLAWFRQYQRQAANKLTGLCRFVEDEDKLEANKH
jgi:hypothetical protein